MDTKGKRDIDRYLPLPPNVVELEEVCDLDINPLKPLGWQLYNMDKKCFLYLTNLPILNGLTCRVHEGCYWQYCFKQNYYILAMDASHIFHYFDVLDIIGSMGWGRHTEEGMSKNFDIIDLPMILGKPYD